MKKTLILLSLILSVAVTNGLAQNDPPPPIAKPKATPSPTPKISVILQQNYEQSKNLEIPRETREQAYNKLLEGQRYVWSLKRLRSQTSISAGVRFARQSFQKAVELDPKLSEGYTALAELFIVFNPTDFDEAANLASIAVNINPDNFGGNRYLAISYLVKSKLGSGNFSQEIGKKAIESWKKVSQLDPRRAEAWFWLNELYNQTNQDDKRIEALQGWLASSPQVDNQKFLPENAVMPLGEALVKAGRNKEAVEVLRQALLGESDTAEIIQLLSQTSENVDVETATSTIEYLQRAVFENQDNSTLIELLALFQGRAGKTDDAVKTIRPLIEKVKNSDEKQAANLLVILGDIYAVGIRENEAIQAYKDSLKVRQLEKNQATTDEDREFAMRVFGKIINLYKNNEKFAEAKNIIELSRLVLGKDDLYVDNQLINLYNETGKKNESLQIIRAIRQRFAKATPANTNALVSLEEYSYIRREANLLTELGKVDEGVALMKTLLKGKTASVGLYGDFDIYLFISGMYSDAKRGKDAIENAKTAIQIADNNERKQLGNLVLATAQNESGDFSAAEITLKSILKQTPNNPIALNNLGYFLTEQNLRLPEALDLITEAVKIDPTNPSFLDSLGWVYFKLGKLDEAEKYLKEAIRFSPNATTSLDHLGDVYFKQGKFDLANRVWKKAIGLSSNADEISKIKTKLSKNSLKP